jgi:hypothetical protein
MVASPFSSQEIRATAEVHRELGPEYHDAVVESFLAKIEKEIEARVDARLANPPPPRSRELDPATLAERRLSLRYMALGTVTAGIPWSFFSFAVMYRDVTLGPRLLELSFGWTLSAAVYAVAAALCRRQWRRDR